ncbi:MAG: hypothetical protein QXS69_03760 [Candidatus Aenigmatarchaeota archaeon]
MIKKFRKIKKQNIEGYFDGITDDYVVYGWAYDRSNPRRRLIVQVFDKDKNLLGIGVANIFREDLKNIGLGDGHYGFQIKLKNDTEIEPEKIKVIADFTFELPKSKDFTYSSLLNSYKRSFNFLNTDIPLIEHIKYIIENEKIKVVCFDFFDTLVKRTVLYPTQFFYHLGDILRQRKLIPHWISPSLFFYLRTTAEKRAREKKMPVTDEVSIYEIWNELKQILSLSDTDIVKMVEIEIEEEIKNMFLVIPLIEMLRFAIDSSKKVFVVSDTYFSGEQLKYIFGVLLEKCPHKIKIPLEKITFLTSSDNHIGKSRGLFLYLYKFCQVESNEILVIGDNYISDVETPQKLGMEAIFIPHGTSKLFDTIYKELVYIKPDFKHPNVTIGRLNNIRALFPLYKSFETVDIIDHFYFGYCILGPIIYGYLRWIEDLIKNLEEEKTYLLGLYREGVYLLKLIKKFCTFSNNVSFIDFAVSRFVLLKATINNLNFDSLSKLVPSRDFITIDTFAKFIGLSDDDFPEEFKNMKINKMNDDFKIVCEYILNSKKLLLKIEKHLFDYKNRIKKYLNSIFQNIEKNSKIFLIDIGWAGSIQKMLTEYIEHLADNIVGLYLAINDQGLSNINSKCKMCGFLFEGTASSEIASIILRFVELMEQSLTPTEHGTTIDYDEFGNPIFLYPAISKKQQEEIIKIQDGIEQFLREAFRTGTQFIQTERLEDLQRISRAIITRAIISPTIEELNLFRDWEHDNNIADHKLEYIVNPNFYFILDYFTPSQIISIPFDYAYYPITLCSEEEELLMAQAYYSIILNDSKLFELKKDIQVFIELLNKNGEKILLNQIEPQINLFNKFCIDFKIFKNLYWDFESIMISLKFEKLYHIILDKILFLCNQKSVIMIKKERAKKFLYEPQRYKNKRIIITENFKEFLQIKNDRGLMTINMNLKDIIEFFNTEPSTDLYTDIHIYLGFKITYELY